MLHALSVQALHHGPGWHAASTSGAQESVRAVGLGIGVRAGLFALSCNLWDYVGAMVLGDRLDTRCVCFSAFPEHSRGYGASEVRLHCQS